MVLAAMSIPSLLEWDMWHALFPQPLVTRTFLAHCVHHASHPLTPHPLDSQVLRQRKILTILAAIVGVRLDLIAQLQRW